MTFQRHGCWLLLLFLFSCVSETGAFVAPSSNQQKSRLSSSSTKSFNTEENSRSPRQNITIERVSCKSRALDVRVFRTWSMSVPEYQQKQLAENNVEVSEQEAIHALTPTYDEEGRDRAVIGQPLVQIVAVCNSKDGSAASLSRTNGVVASVDTQIKKKPGSNANINDDLPWPHAYLKNLDVEESYRRMGIASALVKAVTQYAIDQGARAVFLNVERDNTGAVRLYHSEGYEFKEKKVGDGRMVLMVTD